MPKKPKQEALMRRIKVWELRQQGFTYEYIASEVGMSFNGVASILYREAKKYAATHMEEVAQIKAEQVAQIENVGQEAMLAWERSKEQAKIIRMQKLKLANGDQTDNILQSTEARDQDGDPRYLLVFLKSREDIRKIVGADAPTKSVINGAIEYANLTDEELISKAQEIINAAATPKLTHNSGTV